MNKQDAENIRAKLGGLARFFERYSYEAIVKMGETKWREGGRGTATMIREIIEKIK